MTDTDSLTVWQQMLFDLAQDAHWGGDVIAYDGTYILLSLSGEDYERVSAVYFEEENGLEMPENWIISKNRFDEVEFDGYEDWDEASHAHARLESRYSRWMCGEEID